MDHALNPRALFERADALWGWLYASMGKPFASCLSAGLGCLAKSSNPSDRAFAAKIISTFEAARAIEMAPEGASEPERRQRLERLVEEFDAYQRAKDYGGATS
jgi:hypothetical protein